MPVQTENALKMPSPQTPLPHREGLEIRFLPFVLREKGPGVEGHPTRQRA